jgi:hypothetical protein
MMLAVVNLHGLRVDAARAHVRVRQRGQHERHVSLLVVTVCRVVPLMGQTPGAFAEPADFSARYQPMMPGSSEGRPPDDHRLDVLVNSGM